MALLASGTSVRGRLITNLAPATTSTYRVYFPDLPFNYTRLLGGICSVQPDRPVTGVWSAEEFTTLWTYSTRWVPLRGSADRRICLYFSVADLNWQLWD